MLDESLRSADIERAVVSGMSPTALIGCSRHPSDSRPNFIGQVAQSRNPFQFDLIPPVAISRAKVAEPVPVLALRGKLGSLLLKEAGS